MNRRGGRVAAKQAAAYTISMYAALTIGASAVAGDDGHSGCNHGDTTAPKPAPTEAPAVEPAPATQTETIVDKGLRIDFKIEPAYGPEEERLPLIEGQLADISFRITDAQTGAPVSALQPAVWVNHREGFDSGLGCKERISKYLQGLLSFQADIDLNKYFILVLNTDGTISVVDPLLGVSGVTQLYTMIHLDAEGADWVRSADEKRMYVSLPSAGRVAVVDLENFKVSSYVDVGSNPVRLALQPDGKYLWVARDGATVESSGISVVDTGSLERVASISTGPGHHEIVFTADSLVAYVSNSLGDTVSVIDTQRLATTAEIAVGDGPVAMSYSRLSNRVYAASAGDGSISEIDPDSNRVTATVRTSPGVVAMEASPDGRWIFIVNAEDNRVEILDSSRSAIVRSLPVGEQPHQLAFTDTYAYVRHLGTADVTLVPLSQLGGQDTPAIKTVALGTRGPGEAPLTPIADAITPTGEWTAVVAANPADKMVYYYMEGMIAPMGSYSTYGRVPRAVAIADRSVRERDRGTYAARIRVPSEGPYTVAMLIDSPVVDHCFSFAAAADPLRPKATGADGVRLSYLNTERQVAAGSTLPVRLFFARSDTGEPVDGLGDVSIIATRPPGHWQQRGRAASLGDGIYEFPVEAGQPGAYFVSVAVPSLGIDYTELPFMTFRASAQTETVAARDPAQDRAE